jgi:hypothetical protein
VQWDTVRKISGHDPFARPVHLLDAPQQIAAHHRAADQAHAERDRPGPQKGRSDLAPEGCRIADVAPDQQPIAARDHEEPAPGGMKLAVAVNSSLEGKGQPRGMCRYAGRPSRDIAGERLSLRVGHQINHGVAAIAGAARRHDLDQPAQTSLRVLLGKPGDLGVQRRLGLPLYKTCAGQVDEQQNAEHGGRKYQEVKRGQPECMSPDDQSGVPEELGCR